jgi:hypothetical protein
MRASSTVVRKPGPSLPRFECWLYPASMDPWDRCLPLLCLSFHIEVDSNNTSLSGLSVKWVNKCKALKLVLRGKQALTNVSWTYFWSPGQVLWGHNLSSGQESQVYKGPALGVMLCFYCLDILRIFFTKKLPFSFCTGPTNYVTSSIYKVVVAKS